VSIPDEAVEAAAKALDEMRTNPDTLMDYLSSAKVARAALEAAAPFIQAQAWDVCAGAVEAATRLVAPDHITPMGARIINKTAANNPYRKENQ
jgi:hypothetical protein